MLYSTPHFSSHQPPGFAHPFSFGVNAALSLPFASSLTCEENFNAEHQKFTRLLKSHLHEPTVKAINAANRNLTLMDQAEEPQHFDDDTSFSSKGEC